MVNDAAAQTDRFADRPQTAGRGRSCAAGKAAIQQKHRDGALRQFVSHGTADHAAANHDHVRSAGHGATSPAGAARSPTLTGVSGGRTLTGPISATVRPNFAAIHRAAAGQHMQP